MKTQQIEDQATTTCMGGSGLSLGRREWRRKIWGTGFKLPDHKRREKKMRHIFSQAILSALLVLLATTPAGATEFWVDGLDGNDANDGLTVASAKRIIQAAVDLAISPGDVVNVLPGEYFGGFALDAPQSGITVRGIGEVVIRLGGSSVENVSGTLTRIETITFRRGSSFDSDRALSISVSSDVRVERCRFLDDDRAALAIGTLTSVQRLTICECLFADNPRPAGANTIGDG
ncbi:MAG: hypothetical protein IH897_09410, partial [Planctomycetes bacterium]|nr:hypothetical protein [Planctomycetota bacterium]